MNTSRNENVYRNYLQKEKINTFIQVQVIINQFIEHKKNIHLSKTGENENHIQTLKSLEEKIIESNSIIY
jgi:hypothetical protein